MTRPDFIVVAGSDVGKSKLDAHILDPSLDHQFKNDKPGRRALRNWLLRHGVNRTVLEPIGRHHRRLHHCLFGLALFDRDSGQHHGGRCIRGGCAHPRVSTWPRFAGNAPPLPATNASSPRASLTATIVAIMRKLVCLLNTLLREDRLWPTEPPTRELAAAPWAR